MPVPVTTSASVMTPVVTVPVLSSTTVSTERVDSRTSGPLMSTPICAPRPVPTSSAVGVARPSAHGHAMMRTATAAVNAAEAGAPAPSHAPRAPTAIAMAMGTKIADTRSARRWTCALPDCASSTRRAICASWVSPPTRVARTTSRPPALTVAPVTASPSPTSTGTDSPVSIEASTAEVPATTVPSVAIFPGPHDELVAHRELGDRDAGLRAVAQHRDVLRAELEQGPQRGACLPLDRFSK